MNAADALLVPELEAELDRELPLAVREFARQLAARGGDSTVAVLFYGSTLRTGDLDGLLDFYVLLDGFDAWYENRLEALANRCLPPNVSYEQLLVDGQDLRAKVAVLTLDQFRDGMRFSALDTTLWARFTQPLAIAWIAGPEAQTAVKSAIAAAVRVAARWAALLGPLEGRPDAFWTALFERTYAAELRVERGDGRARLLVGSDDQRYRRLLPLAWRAEGIGFAEDPASATLRPQLTAAQRQSAERAWALRRFLGKPLNLARLLKSTFTFKNAADYAAWKVERHSGVRLELSEWQRRHPLLAAPGVYRQLRKKKVLR